MAEPEHEPEHEDSPRGALPTDDSFSSSSSMLLRGDDSGLGQAAVRRHTQRVLVAEEYEPVFIADEGEASQERAAISMQRLYRSANSGQQPSIGVQNVNDKVARAIEQKQRKKQERREEHAARKIQRWYLKLHNIAKWNKAYESVHRQRAAEIIQRKYRRIASPKLKVTPVVLHRLHDVVVQELRMLARKRPSGDDARQPDEEQRLYDILMCLPAFREVLERLPHRARRCAIRKLESRQLLAGDALLTNAKGERVDAAALVLAGEGVIYTVNQETPLSTMDISQRLCPGSEVSISMIDEMRINKECRCDYHLKVSCKATIEVLRLSTKFVDSAVSSEVRREEVRSLARETLRISAPWCRESEDLVAISRHLLDNVFCFEGVLQNDIAKVCQQANLTQVVSGEYLCRFGEMVDGLRVLLSGTVSEFLPCLPALERLEKNELCDGELATERILQASAKTFGDCIRTISVDDACGEWELCCERDDRFGADVVADCDCQVLFISRALYTRYMMPARCQKVLRQASLTALTLGSAAAIKVERSQLKLRRSSLQRPLSTMSSPLLTVPSLMPAAPSPLPMAPSTFSTAPSLRSAASSPLLTVPSPLATALSPAPSAPNSLPSEGCCIEVDPNSSQGSFSQAQVWMLPEHVAAIDCMLGYHSECSLPLLKSFPRDLRREICARGKLWRATRGEVLYFEETPADLLFVVVRGEVGLFQRCDVEDPDFEQQRQQLYDCCCATGARATKELFAMPDPTTSKLGEREDEEELSCFAPQNQRNDEEKGPISPKRSMKRSMTRSMTMTRSERARERVRAVLTKLATAVFDVAARRWQSLWPARVSALPVSNGDRTFIRDGEAEILLLGMDLSETQKDKGTKDSFVDVAQLGLLTEIAEEGQALGIASPGLPGGGPPRSRTAVALSATVELFVLDHEAVSKVVGSGRDGTPGSNYACAILRAREGHERTPQDLMVLDRLIREHQAFANLECRTRAEICRMMRLVTVPQDEAVCRQDDEAIGFFQVLRGQAGLHVREQDNSHFCLFDKECLSRNDEFCDTQDDDGPMVLCLGEGSTFGEQSLLGKESVQPQTIRAVDDLELAWIESHDYEDATHDWLGEASSRRRALEVLRKPIEERTDKDATALIHILRHVQWIQDLEAPLRLEVARHMSLVHLPAAGRMVQPAEGYSLSVVLAGCIGRYPVDPKAERGSDPCIKLVKFSSHESQPHVSRPESQVLQRAGKHIGSLLEASQLSKEEEHQIDMHRELQELQTLKETLVTRIGHEPLKASLKERLQLHSVHQQLQKLEAKMTRFPLLRSSDEATSSVNHRVEVNGDPNVAFNLSCPPSYSQISGTSLSPAPGQNTTLCLDSEAKLTDSSSIDSNAINSAANLDQDSSHPGAFDLTQLEDSSELEMPGLGLPPGILDVDGCDIEFREGEAFGGWTESEPVHCKDDLHAHNHTDLLVLTPSMLKKAVALLRRRAAQERAEFLRLHLPSEATSDVIEKVAPLFHDEVKQKGSVLVREGCHSNIIWMIVEGTCTCTLSQGLSAGAPGTCTHQDENPVSMHLTDAKHPDGTPRRGDGDLVRIAGRKDSVLHKRESMTTESKPASGPSPASRCLPAGTSIGRCTKARGIAVGGDGHAPVTVGLLNKGKIIGLFSALLQRPEPHTVMVSSAQAKVLAISKNKFIPYLPISVYETLKGVLQTQSDWHSNQSSRLAALPAQVGERLASVRCEVHQAHVPRVIDSPFLRRYGMDKLEMLDIVVGTYGRMVHPESEWLFASRTTDFFEDVCLANLQGGHPEALYYEKPTNVPSGERHTANLRFRRFNRLCDSMEEESHDNDYLASGYSEDVGQLSPQNVSKFAPSNSGYQRQTVEPDLSQMSDVNPAANATQEHRPVQELELEAKVNSSRIQLHKPSRVQQSTEHSEMRMALRKTVCPLPPKKPPPSHGREVHKAAQVYQSKAMRDRQLGISDHNGSLESPVHGTPSASSNRNSQNSEGLPTISARGRPTDFNRQLSTGTSDSSPTEQPSPSKQNSLRPIPMAPMNSCASLRRGTTQILKAQEQMASSAPDTSLHVGDESPVGRSLSGGSHSGTLCRKRPSDWKRETRELVVE